MTKKETQALPENEAEVFKRRSLSLTDSQYESVLAEARKRGLNFSSLVRMVLLDYIDRESA